MKKLILIFSLNLLLLTQVFAESSESDEDDEIVGRVLFGMVAKPESFPFQVSIQEKRGSDTLKFCGGVIIAPQWVLTAAHCVDDIKNQSSFTEDIRVKAGVLNAWKLNSHSQYIKVSKIISHPKYNLKGDTENDIALLLLKHPFQFNKVVSPIALPPKNYKAKGWGEIAGWGAVNNDESKSSDVLKWARLEVSKMSVCEKYWTMSKGQICLGFGQKENACAGDSGGPFIQNIKGKKSVVGVTSFGTVGCYENDPIVYTEVSHFRDWIKKSMAAEKDLEVKLKSEYLPYLVSIYSKDVDDNTYDKLCSGVILTDRFVLTSAHCLDNAGEEARKHLRIRVKNNSEVTSKDFVKVKKILKSPDYHEEDSSLFHDYAILKTRLKIKLASNDLTAIEVFSKNLTTDDKIKAQIIGYDFSAKSNGRVLTKTSVKLVSNKCGTIPKDREGNEWQMCVVTTGDEFCNTDSNAPVVIKIDGKPYLFGLNSFATPECKSRKPFFISSMDYYKPTIDKIMWLHTS